MTESLLSLSVFSLSFSFFFLCALCVSAFRFLRPLFSVPLCELRVEKSRFPRADTESATMKFAP